MLELPDRWGLLKMTSLWGQNGASSLLLQPLAVCRSSGELIPGLYSGFGEDASYIQARSKTTGWIIFTFWLPGSCIVYSQEDPEEMRITGQVPVWSSLASMSHHLV